VTPTAPAARLQRIDTPAGWIRLVSALAAVFALFHWSAAALGSDRGQAGLAVAAAIVAAVCLAERLLFGASFLRSLPALGLGAPRRRGLAAAAAICLLMLLAVPAFAWTTRGRLTFYPGAWWLMPGLFAQAGIAEEVLFRGYLFGHLRRGRSFWPAALLSMLPFVAVHLLLFATMPWPIAAAAMVLAVVVAFPMARLYELGGETIWAPALLHFVIQGTVKIVVVPDASSIRFAVLWMAVSAIVPMLVFALRRDTRESPRARRRNR
jgi:membrane protease YdiL (CAAX protease family)